MYNNMLFKSLIYIIILLNVVIGQKSSNFATIERASNKSLRISMYSNYTSFNVSIYNPDFVHAFRNNRKELVQVLKQAGAKFLRYPGGTVVEHYHWEKHIFNPDGNDAFESFKKGNSRREFNNKDYMNVDEFITLCQEVGAEPIIVLNIFTGSVKEVASLVSHLNIKNKYKVKYFEIGNDEYHIGIKEKYLNKPRDSYGMTPAEYGTILNDYWSEIKKNIS